jgi:flagellar protein FlaI
MNQDDGGGDGVGEEVGPGEDLVRFEDGAPESADATEEIVAWSDPDGVEAATAPGPADDDAATPDPTGGTDPDRIREEVLAVVHEHFEGADPGGFAPHPDESFVDDRWFDFSYLEGHVELDRTWVAEPYAYVSVLYDDEEKTTRYHVSEPVLDEFEGYVHEDLTRVLRDSLLYQDIEDEGDRERLFEREAKAVVADHAATVQGGSLHKLLYYLTRDFVDYGKVDPIMRDPAVEDVSCDGVDVPVFVYHREYRDLATNVRYGATELDSATVRLAQRAGKSISVSAPLVDASLPDGSRIQLTLGGEVSTRGSNFTVRKFADVPYTPVDLVEWNTFSVEEMAYLWLAIENGKSLVFAGGTGSGKTTSMNAVSFFIPPDSKVVSIEDTREITLPHDNWIQSVARSGVTEGGRGEIDTYQLLQASLRQRPEYLLVGEIRTEQEVALTFFQAMTTGHTAYTTIHADSIEGALARLQNPPLSVPAQMIRNLDVVSIQKQIRTEQQRVRRNQAIVEILPGEDPSTVDARTVFQRDPRTDDHERVAESNVLAEIADERGWDLDRVQEELSDRREVLDYLVDNDIADYAEVTALIHTYARDPGYVLERVRSGDLTAGDSLVEGGDLASDDPVVEEPPAADAAGGEDVATADGGAGRDENGGEDVATPSDGAGGGQ